MSDLDDAARQTRFQRAQAEALCAGVIGAVVGAAFVFVLHEYWMTRAAENPLNWVLDLADLLPVVLAIAGFGWRWRTVRLRQDV